MRKRTAFTVTAGIVFLFALTASTVNADMVHADRFLGNGNAAEQLISLPDTSRAESHAYLFAEHSNNGKHLGFSVASFRGGPKIGLVGHNPGRSSVTENPEPATMFLLGTGLAAVGAIIRRKKKVE